MLNEWVRRNAERGDRVAVLISALKTIGLNDVALSEYGYIFFLFLKCFELSVSQYLFPLNRLCQYTNSFSSDCSNQLHFFDPYI